MQLFKREISGGEGDDMYMALASVTGSSSSVTFFGGTALKARLRRGTALKARLRRGKGDDTADYSDLGQGGVTFTVGAQVGPVTGNTYATERRFTLKTTTNADGSTSVTKDYIADNHDNADNFWWSPNTTIMDPQRNDILTFFGIPLIGGNDSGGLALNSYGLGANVGLAAGRAQLFDAQKNFIPATKVIYVDQLLPFITYGFQAQADGSYDLHVGNVLTVFLDVTESLYGGGSSGLSAKLKDHKGAQVVKDFIPSGSPAPVVYRGEDEFSLAQQGKAGKLGLVFKKSNPIAAILDLLPPTAISYGIQTAFGGNPLVDAAYSGLAVASRYAKALKWSTGGDPLVLDFSGTGLVTSNLGDSNVHFDLNNDLFSERTAWLSSDAGFLVFDKNANGRVDDANELFGTFTGSGFDDLRAYDGNADGIINANDAIFSQLQVWVDTNSDGVSQASELHSLAQLGVTQISLNATTLNARNSEGTELRAAASFTQNGVTKLIYEAIFPTDQTDTIYRGESGKTTWAGSKVIDVKGFGSVTNLAIAATNDFDLAALVAQRSSQMTTPDLRTLVTQAGDVSYCQRAA